MKISADRESVKSALIFDTISYVDRLRSLSTKKRKTRKAIDTVIISLEDLLGELGEIDPNFYRGSNRKRSMS